MTVIPDDEREPESDPSAPDAAPAPTPPPVDRRYTVRLSVEIVEHAPGGDTYIFEDRPEWRDMPYPGVLAMELELIEFQRRMVAVGVHSALAGGCRPEHRDILLAMAAGLPVPAAFAAAHQGSGAQDLRPC